MSYMIPEPDVANNAAPAFVIVIAILAFLLICFISFALSVASYVLNAVAYMKLGKKAGVKNGALAFFPLTNIFYYGKIAEKDGIINRGKTAKWSVIYLILSIAAAVSYAIVNAFSAVIQIFIVGLDSIVDNIARNITGIQDPESVVGFLEFSSAALLITVLILIILGLVYIAVSIARTVIAYIVLYKTYHLFAPESAGWLLVLSIFVSGASFIILLVLAFSKKFKAHPATESSEDEDDDEDNDEDEDEGVEVEVS